MGDQVDLSALALLPDTIKRKILSTLQPAAELDNPLQTQAHAQASKPAASSIADAISGRNVQLPSLGAAGACVVDSVLSQQEAKEVAAAVEAWLASHGRRPGMGASGSGGLWHDPQHRGDITSWATVQELQQADQPLLAAVLQMMMALKQQLGYQGLDVSGRCSVQLACYPGVGARYVRHADASDAVPDRTVTALLYLNDEWDVQRDGGQLALYNAVHSSCAPAGASSSNSAEPAAAVPDLAVGHLLGEPALLVAPLGGRLLVFDSRLQHEVLPSQRHRYSITVFFYRSKPAPGTAAAGGGATSAAAITRCNTAGPPAAGPEHALTDTPAASIAPTAPGTVQAGTEDDQAGTAAVAALTMGSEPQPASSHAPLGNAAGPLPRIFVSIAAFRDDECQWTLRDLFVKAAHPERVFVGVVWQVDPLADQAFTRMAGGDRTAPFQQQVREVRLHYRTATGPCAARSLAQQLWAGEEFVLQIDAHMRFVQDWDVLCLQQLQLAQQAACSDRVVLSTYPLGYSGQGAAAQLPEQPPATLLCAKAFDEQGLLRIQARSLHHRPPGPLASYFWAAGFSFSPAAWLLEVPYCPHLPHLFFGEEVYMLARMVTRGWQVWAPNQALLFHQWERSARAVSYQACMQVDVKARAASQAKVLLLLQGGTPLENNTKADVTQLSQAHPTATAPVLHAALAPTDADWARGGVWGLGTVNTLQQFEELCGVRFRNTTVEPRALYGGQDAASFVD